MGAVEDGGEPQRFGGPRGHWGDRRAGGGTIERGVLEDRGDHRVWRTGGNTRNHRVLEDCGGPQGTIEMGVVEDHKEP